MTYQSWIDDEEAAFDPLGPEGRSRGESRHGTFIGIATGVAAGCALAAAAVWAAHGSLGSFAFGVADPAPSSAVVELPAVLASAGADVTEMAFVTPSGAIDITIDRIFVTTHGLSGRPFASSGSPASAAGAPTVQVTRSVPLPMANPLFAGRTQGGDGLRALEEIDRGGVPLPQRNPLQREQRLAYASLPDATAAPLTEAPSLTAKPAEPQILEEGDIALPTPGSGYAVYDIKGRKLYLPSGERLEAHSGYGDNFDDVRSVHIRMVGPTPPNTYSLKMREALFHGTEAVRMNPIGTGKMYGRTGILLHPYLLGPRGDSNGCVSIKEYDKFLAAFKRGEVQRVVVVAQLKNAPAEPNSLLSWLKGSN